MHIDATSGGNSITFIFWTLKYVTVPKGCLGCILSDIMDVIMKFRPKKTVQIVISILVMKMTPIG